MQSLTITTTAFAANEGLSPRAAQRLLADLQANYGLKPLRKGLWSREAMEAATKRAGEIQGRNG